MKRKSKALVTTTLLALFPALLIGCGSNDIEEVQPEVTSKVAAVENTTPETEVIEEENPNHNGIEAIKRNNILSVVQSYIEKMENLDGVEPLDEEVTIFESVEFPVLDRDTDEVFPNVYSVVGSFTWEGEEHSYRISLSFRDEELEIPGKLLMYMSGMDTAHFDETVIFPKEGL